MNWREENNKILKDTLEITDTCQYECDGRLVRLKENKEAHRTAIVITEEIVTRLKGEHILQREETWRSTVFSVTNKDSYDAAMDIMNSNEWKSQRLPGRIFV